MENQEMLDNHIINNNLFAKFMGGIYLRCESLTYEPKGSWRNLTGVASDAKQWYDLNYNSSYEWLMPVLEKIESLGYGWDVGVSKSSHYHYCKIYGMDSIEGISPLDAIYGACIEFIKWYNTID
jgi:hypothetical protein